METEQVKMISLPTPPTESRAVLLKVEPGTSENCPHCEQRVSFVAAAGRYEVVANVYEGGKWVRVEHYHPDCYEKADKPYQEAELRLRQFRGSPGKPGKLSGAQQGTRPPRRSNARQPKA